MAAASSSRSSTGCGPVLPFLSPRESFHSISPVHFSSSIRSNINPSSLPTKKPKSHARIMTCMCSPTTHPGSFKCSLHKDIIISNNHHQSTSSYRSNGLNARRSVMTISRLRTDSVEGNDVVKRALAALIRPSSHQQRLRRGDFKPIPSRMWLMSKANEIL